MKARATGPSHPGRPSDHMTHYIFLHIIVSLSSDVEETTNQPWKVPRTGSQSDAAASTSTASRPVPLPMGYPAPGHREAYRSHGIPKIQVRAGRTRGNQLTPEEEHQQLSWKKWQWANDGLIARWAPLGELLVSGLPRADA